MLKSLLKLYAMVVLAAALALIGVNKSFVWMFHDTLTHGERELRKGYAFTLQDYLDRAGPAGRDAALARLNEHAWERFDFVDPDTVPDLSAQQRRDLAELRTSHDSGEEQERDQQKAKGVSRHGPDA